MRKRSNDRVGSPGGSSLFDLPNGTLPRATNRDYERGLLYSPARAAVYLESIRTGRLPRKLADGRVFSPFRVPAKHAVRRSEPRVVIPSWRVMLKRMPHRVRFCVQRKQRREVLFAYRRAGYSGSVKKQYIRRTYNSSYGC